MLQPILFRHVTSLVNGPGRSRPSKVMCRIFHIGIRSGDLRDLACNSPEGCQSVCDLVKARVIFHVTRQTKSEHGVCPAPLILIAFVAARRSKSK